MNESTLCFLRYIEQKHRKFEGHTFAEWRAFWLRELVDDEFYMDWQWNKGLAIDPSRSHCMCPACKAGTIHASDCAVHNAPALPVGDCDCGLEPKTIEEPK